MKLDSPHVSPVNNENYRLDHAVRVTADGYLVTVEAGFVTDGASIPRLLWRVVGHPFMGLVLLPAIIHDALYQSEALPRDVCDRIFFDLLVANGVNKNKARVMYWGVRIGGGFVWRGHDVSDVAMAKKLVTVKEAKK